MFSVQVIDYSLLVGVDNDSGEIVVGLIDYVSGTTSVFCWFTFLGMQKGVASMLLSMLLTAMPRILRWVARDC